MKELEDYHWFPQLLRNFQTEFIGAVVSWFNVYQPFIEHLKTLSLRPQQMIDLCSGSGEPAISIFRKSHVFNGLVLSDKYPNVLPNPDERIAYKKTPVDVMQMEVIPGVYYTMFNAFHHFGDEDKLRIAEKIAASGSGAFFVEILEPRIDCFIKVIFSATIGVLLFTPFIKPFSLLRLLFTYILPINILTITFDGIVSVLKSRSLTQYRKIFDSYGNGVEVIRLTKGWTPLVIIHIQPKK